MEYPLTVEGLVKDEKGNVLILVLMEYPLTLTQKPLQTTLKVLILVLMEYPLTYLYSVAFDAVSSLNPCSNGIPSDTQ